MQIQAHTSFINVNVRDSTSSIAIEWAAIVRFQHPNRCWAKWPNHTSAAAPNASSGHQVIIAGRSTRPSLIMNYLGTYVDELSTDIAAMWWYTAKHVNHRICVANWKVAASNMPKTFAFSNEMTIIYVCEHCFRRIHTHIYISQRTLNHSSSKLTIK